MESALDVNGIGKRSVKKAKGGRKKPAKDNRTVSISIR